MKIFFCLCFRQSRASPLLENIKPDYLSPLDLKKIETAEKFIITAEDGRRYELDAEPGRFANESLGFDPNQ